MTAVAVVQPDLTRRGTDLSGGRRGTNLVHPHLLDAAAAGAELVIVPELWRTGPFELEATLDCAEPETGGETLAFLQRCACELGVWLHGGSILTWAADAAGRRVFANTSYVIDPGGRVKATYRKRHLFGFDEGEASLLTPGDEIVVVDTPLGPTGLATCYDLRFPEHFRALVDAGAQALVIPAGWPTARIGHWRALTVARAIENQMWVVAANAVGSSGGVELGGHSVVVDPQGDAVAGLDNRDGLLLAAVDPTMPRRARTDFPVLRDRRPAYG
jgi:predicted amidohydrolase